VSNLTHILWREQVAYHEEIMMNMNKTDRRDMTEILLKVTLNAMTIIL
jgi:hypothetical protein